MIYDRRCLELEMARDEALLYRSIYGDEGWQEKLRRQRPRVYRRLVEAGEIQEEPPRRSLWQRFVGWLAGDVISF